MVQHGVAVETAINPLPDEVGGLAMSLSELGYSDLDQRHGVGSQGEGAHVIWRRIGRHKAFRRP
jgi:hypothetical protein